MWQARRWHDPQGRSRGWWGTAGVTGAITLVYVLTAAFGDSVQFNDVRGAAIGAWGLANTGGVSLPSAWGPDIDWWLVPDRLGGVSSNRFPGLFVLGYPGYILERLLVSRPVTSPLDVPMWPSALTGVVVAATAVATFHRLALLHLGAVAAAIATFALGLGTPLWTFGSTGLWPHGPCIALLVLAAFWLRRERVGTAVVALALLPLFRPHLAIVSLVIVIWALRQGEVRVASRLAAGTLLSLGALSLYSSLVFDSVLPAAGYDVAGHIGVQSRGLAWVGEGLLLGTVGWQRGVLVHSTFLLVLLPLLAGTWRSLAWWERAMAIGGVAYLVVQALLAGTQGGGEFFGYRVQVESVVLLAPALLRVAEQRLRSPALGGLAAATVLLAGLMHAAAARF